MTMTGPQSFANRKVLFVMAADAEYGPCLKSRIVPLMTGVGPVEAAVAVTQTLSVLDRAGKLPDLVVSLGSAGSRKLIQAAVYQVASVEYRDMDASAFGFAKGQTPFLDLPICVPLPCPALDLPSASLATGASVVSGGGYDDITADMVDMETFAVMRACQLYGVPVVGLRGISDGAERVASIEDWTQYLHVVDKNLADALDRLAVALVG